MLVYQRVNSFLRCFFPRVTLKYVKQCKPFSRCFVVDHGNVCLRSSGTKLLKHLQSLLIDVDAKEKYKVDANYFRLVGLKDIEMVGGC